MNKSSFYIVAVLIVVVELAGLRQQMHAQAGLRAENRALESEMRRMSAENLSATNQVSVADGSASPSGQLAELNRLRSEAADQQRQIQDVQSQLAVQSALPTFQSLAGSNRFVNLTKDSWTSAGYSTPEAALETMLWATAHGDVNAIRDSFTPAELERRNNGVWKGKSDSEIADTEVQGLNQVDGIQILNLQRPSTNTAHFTVFISGMPQPDQPLWMDLTLIDGEWKVDTSEHRLAK